MSNTGKEKGRASDPPHHNPDTDTDTAASLAKAKDFELFPRAVSWAVRAGELTGKQFHVLSFLIGDMDWQTHEWRGTLVALQEMSDFPDTSDYLRKNLHDLRELEWICFEMKQGQRHYLITFGPRYFEALYGQRSDKGQTQTPPLSLNLPQTDDPMSVPSSSNENGDRSNSQHRIDPSPYTETIRDDTETIRDEQKEVPSGEGEDLEPSELASTVNAAIETAKDRQPEGRSS